MQSKFALFIGDWNPFTDNDLEMIKKKLLQNIPVFIWIYDNPPESWETLWKLVSLFKDNNNVRIEIMPDIESVYYE